MIYAIQAQTGREDEVIALMRRAKLWACAPHRKLIERRGGAKREVVRACLPGYVFISTSAPIQLRDYYTILDITGVIRFLGMDRGAPRPLTADDEARFNALNNGGEPIGISAGRRNADGSITIERGWLTGKVHLILKADAHRERAKVRVEMAGMSTIEVGLRLLRDN